MLHYQIGDSVKSDLEKYVNSLVDTSEIKDDVYFVMCEDDGSGKSKATYPGIDTTINLAKQGKSVVMLSISGSRFIADNKKWQAAMGYPNVSHCDALRIKEDIAGAVKSSIDAKKPKDELAIELGNMEIIQNEVGVLKHDLKYVLTSERHGHTKEGWITRAKKVFGDLTFDELQEKLENYKTEETRYFDGKDLKGIFIDIEGTLIQNGAVNRQLVEELKKMSEEKPITIWSDGNLKQFSGVLRENGVYWKIVPKGLFKGAKAEEVFDDLNEEEFVKEYEIEPIKYNQINTLKEGELLSENDLSHNNRLV